MYDDQSYGSGYGSQGGGQDPYGGYGSSQGSQDPYGGYGSSQGSQDPYGGYGTQNGGQDPYGGYGGYTGQTPSQDSGTPAPEEPAGTYRVSPQKILLGLIGGGVGFAVAEVLYQTKLREMSGPVLVGLFFTIIAAGIFLAVLATSASLGDTRRFKKKNKNKPLHLIIGAAGLAAIFLLTMLFEYLYEIDRQEITEPTSYIFALDVSGSMDTTDHGRQMAPAMEKIVKDMDAGFPYSVYLFSSKPQMLVPMHPKEASDEAFKWDLNYSGGTAITGTLDQILTDYRTSVANGTWEGGTAPKVILMTDGMSGDDGFFGRSLNKVIKEYNQEGIQISTVGVSSYDRASLEKIASSTGGVCITIDNIDNIYDTMKAAIKGRSSRTLLSTRYRRSGLLAFLRILFLTVIGALFILIFFGADCVENDLGYIIVVKLLTALVGALLTELWLQALQGNEFFIHIVLAALTSFAIMCTLKKTYSTAEIPLQTGDPYPQYPQYPTGGNDLGQQQPARPTGRTIY